MDTGNSNSTDLKGQSMSRRDEAEYPSFRSVKIYNI